MRKAKATGGLLVTIDKQVERHRARLAALPDPGDEPRPNRRAELETQQRELNGKISGLLRHKGKLEKVESRLRPLRPWRDELIGARDVLRKEIARAKRKLETHRGSYGDERQIEREVLELQEALDAVVYGWEWIYGMALPNIPPRLGALLPGTDWTTARRLPEVEELIAELEHSRDELTKSVPN